MTLLFVYDSETTGHPDWKAPSEDPAQPRIVQLAAALVDEDTRAVVQAMDVIIRPAGWEIPEETTRVHGISTELALDVGVDESLALEMFFAIWGGRLRIGHNESFDARIVRIAQHRHLKIFNEQDLAAWKDGQAKCTAILSKSICCLPPTEAMLKSSFKNTFKTPNLQEAYRHFYGENFNNAHSAMADVNACMAVYWAIQDHTNTEAKTA